MANGLIGGFGSFGRGQTQGQSQGSLLGNVFQEQPTAGQLRRGLFNEVVQQYSGNAQQTGGAAIGAGLGIGISKLLGRDVEGAERANKIRRVQERVSREQAENFANNPYEAFRNTASALFDEGLQAEGIAALRESQRYAPTQEEIDRSQIDQSIPPLNQAYNKILSSDLSLDEQEQTLSQIDTQLSQLPSSPKVDNLKERVTTRLQSLRSDEGSRLVTPGTPEFEQLQEQVSQFGSSLPTDQGAIEVKFDDFGRPVNYEGASGGVEIQTPSPAQEEILKEAAKARDRLSEKRDLLLESGRVASNIYEGGASEDLGVVGFASRIGDGILKQAESAAEEFGVNIIPSNYDFGNFEESAVEAVQTRSALLAYAFSIAKADNEGRVTEADVQKALDQVAGSSGSIEQVKAGISTRLGNSIKALDDVILARQSDFDDIPGLSAPSSVSDFMINNPDRYNRELLQDLGLVDAPRSQTDAAPAASVSGQQAGQGATLRYNANTGRVE